MKFPVTVMVLFFKPRSYRNDPGYISEARFHPYI